MESSVFQFPRPSRAAQTQSVCAITDQFRRWANLHLSQVRNVTEAKRELTDGLVRHYHERLKTAHSALPHPCLIEVFVEAYEILNQLQPEVEATVTQSSSERQDLLLGDD